MAAPALQVAHGSHPTLNIVVDTAAILMDSFTRNAKRTEDLFIGASTKCVERALYSDPQLEMPFAGFVTAWSGLATTHPGTALANSAAVPGWPATGGVHGFAGDTGSFIFKDVTSKGGREAKLIDISFTILHLPLIGYTA